MSKLLCAAAFVVVLLADFVTPAAAATEYPWCAQYSGRSGGRNCGFSNYSQCMATVSGIGGFCERNQFYQGRRSRR